MDDDKAIVSQDYEYTSEGLAVFIKEESLMLEDVDSEEYENSSNAIEDNPSFTEDISDVQTTVTVFKEECTKDAPPSTSKGVGKGKPIPSHSREIIYKVLTFMRKEAVEGICIPLQCVHERVAAACGISTSTLVRISREGAEIEVGKKTSFSSPGKKRAKTSPKTSVGDFNVKVIRQTVHRFYAVEKKLPTLNDIFPKIRENTGYTGSITSLRTVMNKIGFRWKKVNYKHLLVERTDIRLQKMHFLRAIKKFRDEGRSIIYVDKTYIHSSDTKNIEWSDGDGLKTPISKGQRLNIVNAGGEMGFVPNAALFFKSGLKTGDNIGDMNGENYCKWMARQLIPNLPSNSVVVMDSAAFHNTQVDRPPSSRLKKDVMKVWLDRHGVIYSINDTKIELYEKVKRNKPNRKIFLINNLLAEHGHTTVMLPPHHPELNPIKNIWDIVKSWVASRNVRFQINNVKALVEERVRSIGPNEWKSVCEKVKEIENEYIERECVMDEMDGMITDINSSESEESETSEESE